VPYFIELNLQLIDLANNFSEAGDFPIGVGDGGGDAGGLMGGGALGLGCKLWGGGLATSRELGMR